MTFNKSIQQRKFTFKKAAHFLFADATALHLKADIGHSRQHAEDLTDPWPMGKCAYEGAFSLYEGLEIGQQ